MAKKKKTEKVVEEIKTTEDVANVEDIFANQVIEVDYNEDLVNKYKSEYIMEEEGTGADPTAEPSDLQTTLNEVPLPDMLDDGEVIIEEVIEDDTNN